MILICVVGAGQMGLRVAATIAQNGYTVRIFDSDVDTLNSVHIRHQDLLNEMHEESVILEDVSPGMILCMSQLQEAVTLADYVFECVMEDILVKMEVIREICKYAKSTAIIASSTMRLPLHEVMQLATHPQRTMGVRFLMPVFYISLVEISLLSGSYGDTANATVNRMRQLLSSMNMTAFLRQSQDPLVLDEAAREEFKQTYIRRSRILSAASHSISNSMPASVLSHQLAHMSLSGDYCSSSLSNICSPNPQAFMTTGNGISMDAMDPMSGSGGASLAALLLQRRLSSVEGNNGGASVNVSQSPHPSSQPPSYSHQDCVFCYERSRNILLRPCCHLILCSECANRLFARGDSCPICRTDIHELISVFST